jgi:hypothetical protein
MSEEERLMSSGLRDQRNVLEIYHQKRSDAANQEKQASLKEIRVFHGRAQLPSMLNCEKVGFVDLGGPGHWAQSRPSVARGCSPA